MFGQKELMQHAVHLEQRVASEVNVVAMDGEESLTYQVAQRGGESHADVDAEFLLKIPFADMAQLELENQFADQPFFLRGPQRPVERQFAPGDALEVWFVAVFVLEMDAAHVGKGSNAQREQIGPLPQQIAIEEFGLGRILHYGICAGHG